MVVIFLPLGTGEQERAGELSSPGATLLSCLGVSSAGLSPCRGGCHTLPADVWVHEWYPNPLQVGKRGTAAEDYSEVVLCQSKHCVGIAGSCC